MPLEKISIQLYSLRSLLQNDPEGTLSAPADIGYRKVELTGTYGRSATEFRAILDRCHLKASSTHVGIDGDLNQTIADAKILGNRSVVVPYANVGTIAEWEAFAGRMNTAAAAFQKAGLDLGYHNHDHEFAPIGGVVPYDVLTSKTDKGLVHLGYYGDIPSYRRILDVEGVAHAADLALVGDERTVAAGLRRYFDAGATEVVLIQSGLRSPRERLRTWQLAGSLS